MDKKKLNIEDDDQNFIQALFKEPKDELEEKELSKPAPDAFNAILDQRKDQRDRVLNSISRLMWASFWLLVILLVWQSLGRTFCDPTFTLLDGYQLQILSVSIFGQIVAVVVIISRALWDDKVYMDKLNKE